MVAVELYNERKLEEKQAEFNLIIKIERASNKEFLAVSSFLKLFPNASLINLNFEKKAVYSDFEFTFLGNSERFKSFYSCKLPKFKIENDNITFYGQPQIEQSDIILSGHSMEIGNSKILSITELENEILDK